MKTWRSASIPHGGKTKETGNSCEGEGERGIWVGRGESLTPPKGGVRLFTAEGAETCRGGVVVVTSVSIISSVNACGCEKECSCLTRAEGNNAVHFSKGKSLE